MRAITLWQPYATLLVQGVKLHETRSWPMPAALLDGPTAIHAARRTIDARDAARIEAEGMLVSDCPLGAVVGWVRFARCLPTPRPGLVDQWGDDSPGRWVWVVDRRCACALDAPLHRRGRQGVWRLDDEAAAHVLSFQCYEHYRPRE